MTKREVRKSFMEGVKQGVVTEYIDYIAPDVDKVVGKLLLDIMSGNEKFKKGLDEAFDFLMDNIDHELPEIVGEESVSSLMKPFTKRLTKELIGRLRS